MTAEQAPRVLITADTVGGVWTHVVELAAALRGTGMQVAIATMGAPVTAAQRAQVAQIPGVGMHESRYRLEWMADPWRDIDEAGEWLLGLEAELKPDVVHLNQFAFGALPFAAATLLVAHSCVLSWWRAVHGTPAPAEWNRYREVVSRGLAGATQIGAPTRAMLASLQADYGFERSLERSLERSGLVLPNARSPRDFAPGVKEPLIVSAGRLWDAAKNLAALEAVAPALPWRVQVAGPTASPDGGGVRKIAGVHALGELSPATLAEVLARASIYALPARYEPFGQTALEAALSGCALVLGDIPSLREVWGSAALYVPPDDAAALRKALLVLIDDAGLRRRMAAQARRRAMHYTPQRMAAAYRAAYAGLLADRAPRSSPVFATPTRAAATICAS